MAAGAAPKLTTWQSLRAVARSWRLLSVTLLSFASGLPLGLVWIAIPAWMARAGIDIKVIGLFTLAQAPWSFKILWSPLMDRYPLPLLGRKRGWVLASQALLVLLGVWLALVSDHPERVWVIGALALAIAFASATQDIAYDAYAVEVLLREEHGLAVGARTALYRLAMIVSGGASITLAADYSWRVVNLALALCYLPCLLVTWFAPEPESLPEPPKTLKDAVWGPFLGLLGQHRALEILAFVILFKLGTSLAESLVRPFLVQVGFGDFDVGLATATIGSVALVVGVFLGGLLCDAVGLGRALWISGVIQSLAHAGYALVAQVGPNRPLMYAAQALEYGTGGLGTGALGVLLLRLTQKRFSATQYALLTSLFSIPRILAGPPTALLVDAIGWRDFFLLTVVAGVPGLVMLSRFVPWSVREPEFHVAASPGGAPIGRPALAGWAVLAGLAGWLSGVAMMAALAGLKSLRAGGGFDLVAPARALLAPSTPGDWMTSGGLAILGALCGLATGATLVARRGIAGGGRR